jgi:class 3 adenylate cyclase
MAELPQGTVTFLFTDIEGSTRLLKALGDRYGEVLEAHRRILREAAQARGGREVDTQGDSFFFAFARANAALGAAVVAQRALSEHEWPEGEEVRVRMGMHTAEPEVGEERYVGLGVHRAARIGAAAQGGQVLLSSSTRPLVEDDVGGVSVRELGLYRLKDFDQPERLYQLDIDGLPSKFPPLNAQSARSSQRRLLLVGAAALAVIIVTAAVFAFTRGGGGGVEVGPTSLAVIDPKSNAVVDAIDLGFKSNLIAAGEGFVWVVDPNGGTLRRIDPHTHEAKTFGIAVGAGDIPFGLAAGAGAVWVAVLRGLREVVLELGPQLGDLRRTIPYGDPSQAPPLYELQPLALGAGAVWAIDPPTGSIWRIPVHAGRAHKLAEGLDALSLAAERGAVWVAGSTGVDKIDAVTGNGLGSAPIGTLTSSETASVAVGLRAAWFATSGTDKLSKIDPESVAPTDTYPVGRGPAGIAVGRGSVWVANSRDGTVSRVDARGGAPRTIDLRGETPGGIVVAYGAVWTSPGEPRS